jgi:hypothetical protein
MPENERDASTDLDDNGWEFFDQWRYSVPGVAKPVQWQGDILGFWPKRLHGLDRTRMMLVTNTVALQLSVQVAHALGSE